MMVTINTDELIGYILRKTDKDLGLSFKEVEAVLDSEQDFLKSKGLIEEREDTGIYINEGWLGDTVERDMKKAVDDLNARYKNNEIESIILERKEEEDYNNLHVTFVMNN